MIDLLNIAKVESDGGNLTENLSKLFTNSDIKPNGYPNAIVWKGGHHNSEINPIAHALTDAYALLGTLAAIDILNLSFFLLVSFLKLINQDLYIY